MSSPAIPRRTSLAVALALLAAGCSAAGSGSGSGDDWYYHWSCNGDSECLITNPTGQATGTVGPEAGGQSGCNSLMAFGTHFWNIPPAVQSCDHSPNNPPPVLLSLTIAPANSTMPLGLVEQFTATGHYSDGSSRDLTSQCAWGGPVRAIGSTPVAEVTAGGVVTATAIGSTTIIADYGTLRATTSLQVVAAALQSLVVTPADPVIANGTTQQFAATGHYTDGTTADFTTRASWSSNNTSVGTVVAGGLARGVGQGTAVITATSGAISGSTTLTVGGAALQGITITPATPQVPQGYGLQLHATGSYTDGSVQDLTSQVAWTSASPGVATIAPTGVATGVSAGTSGIRATAGAIFGTATLTVTPATLVAIAVTPAAPSIAPGTSVHFGAIGTFSDGWTQPLAIGVGWSSGTTAVATVSGGGLASGIAVGTSIISATVGSVVGSTVLTVTLTPPGTAWTGAPGSPEMTPCNSGLGCAFVHFVLDAITWSGTQFVAVANDGGVFTSPDGLAWTVRVPGPDASSAGQDLRGVVWSPSLSRFVAVGSGYVSTSSDLGVTWSANAAAPMSGKVLNGVTWTGTQFVAVGNGGAVLTSPDGLTWTSRTSGTAAALRSVAWSGSQLIAAGDVTLVSGDGVHWSQVDGATGWTGVAWSGRLFVEVGTGTYAGSLGAIRTSPDGLTWTSAPSLAEFLNGIVWTGTQWVAVGGPGPLGQPAFVATSPDGQTWTARNLDSGTFNLRAVAWSGTTLVAVGDRYSVYTSP
jgi:hypothetical protein